MSGSAGRGEQVTILAVEADTDDTEILREELENAKIANDTYIVNNGDDALAFLHQRNDYADSPRPDLILLDPEVPGATGEDILTELNDEDRLKHVPVVVLTDSDDEADVVRSYELHANAYVQTPPDDPDEFTDALRVIEEFWLRIVRLPPEPDDDDGQPYD